MSETYTIWVCVDCIHVHANGECAEGADREPLALLDGMDVTMGLMREEHACTDEQGRTAHDRGEECECETTDFSWTSCDGCGSTLGGERHAMTVWEKAAC